MFSVLTSNAHPIVHLSNLQSQFQEFLQFFGTPHFLYPATSLPTHCPCYTSQDFGVCLSFGYPKAIHSLVYNLPWLDIGDKVARPFPLSPISVVLISGALISLSRNATALSAIDSHFVFVEVLIIGRVIIDGWLI
ncbi:hypothetical protein ACH5RR_040104 [Cinchona calisaya]|uniref:Uncharacterized protein n=1 Tax=Cinchona calisaya TaxID=153742 RepID=A0ABD2XV20_9GENT